MIHSKNTDNNLDDAIQILRCWQILDFLNQSGITEEKAKPGKKEELKKNIKKQVRIYNIDKDINMLYRILTDYEKSSQSQGFTFYIGRVKRQECIKSLAQCIRTNELNLVNSNDEYLPWITFQINKEGQYTKNSFAVSPILWALHTVHHMKDADFKTMAGELTIEKYNSFIEGKNLKIEHPTEERLQ